MVVNVASPALVRLVIERPVITGAALLITTLSVWLTDAPCVSVAVATQLSVSLTAMLAAFLDQKEKEGLKMELAQVIAKILDEEDSVTIFVECSLLQPSWLSLLVKDKMSKNST